MGGQFKGYAQYMTQQLLFDTSVWIDFLRNKNTPEADLLTDYIASNHPLVLTPTIIQEVLQGIRDDAQYRQIKDILSYITTFQLPPIQAAIGAAELYRSLRKKGLTIRKSNDCLIAFYAIEFSTPLAHSDADFDVIAAHSKLKIWRP
jgi:predicted nucleic acid-binding protein